MADFMNIAKTLIAKVEKTLYGEGSTQADGKISTAEENSIFNSELANAVKNGELTQDDAEAIKNTFGFEATGAAKAKNANGITINIDASTSITININIDVTDAIQKLVDELIANFDAKIDEVIKAMNENNENIVQILKALLGSLDGNFSKVIEMLEKICGGQTEAFKNITTILNRILEYEIKIYAKMEDCDFEGLKTALDKITQNQEKQTEVLMAIYAAIQKLGDNQGKYFDVIIGLLNNNNAKLDDILAVLKAIKEDTSENNAISKEILETIKNLSIGGGSGNVDLSGLMAQLTAILNAVKEGNAKQDDILATLKLMNANIEKYGKENTEWLIKIYDKLDTLGGDGNGDANKMLNLILQAIYNLKDGIDVNLQKLLDKLDEILQAIQDHEVHVTVEAECHCHCEGGNDDPNEGIKGDLSGLLSNLGISFDWGESDGITKVEIEGKQLDIMPGKKVFYKDGLLGLPAGTYVVHVVGPNKIAVYGTDGKRLK